MIREIGENAGKVWQYLEKHPSATIEQIAKGLSLKENPACLAIGWLAREGKLEFKNEGKKTKLFLAGQ